jgi:hypothetical protein
VNHLRRNAGISLTSSWCQQPWYYLSGFYSREPGTGVATRALRAAVQAIGGGGPFVLCCEPILGTDPRSLTAKTAHLDPEARTAGLCNYYRDRFGLVCEAPTRCTLRTELTGSGKRWSEPDRTFMWSPLMPQEETLQFPSHSENLSAAATLGSSTKWAGHRPWNQRIQELH